MREKLDRLDRGRLARECARLDPRESPPSPTKASPQTSRLGPHTEGRRLLKALDRASVIPLDHPKPRPHPGLREQSYAKCGALTALPKTRSSTAFGRVEEQTLDLIGFELHRLLGLG